MSYNEYKEQVKKSFIESNPKLDSKAIDKYFSQKDTDDTIRDDYSVFSNPKSTVKVSPNSTAYTLSMLY